MVIIVLNIIINYCTWPYHSSHLGEILASPWENDGTGQTRKGYIGSYTSVAELIKQILFS